ncbi:MAG: hypothetical protein DHS20C18_55210 [Saprospiraceae bacterium]|nr:MAG: hypothetical protein DHS20C18_55210 [Saprospiraceae bacterium]
MEIKTNSFFDIPIYFKAYSNFVFVANEKRIAAGVNSSGTLATQDVLNGNLKIAWYDTTTNGKTLQSGEKMLSLEFDDEPWVSGGSLLTDLILNEADIPALAYQEDGTPMVIRFVSSRGSRLPAIPTHSPVAINTTVTIQPNPTKTEVIFNIHSTKDTPASIIIYDTQGKEVHSVSLELGKGENTYQLNEIRNWPTGLYWYRLETGTESLSGKIFKK